MFSPKHITGTATADEVVLPGERREWLREHARFRWLEWVPELQFELADRSFSFRGVTSLIRCVCRQRNHQPGLKGKYVG